MSERTLDIDVERYEALVRSTARMIVKDPSRVVMDYDEICQRLRIKAWKAMMAFDPTRSQIGVDRFVFGAIQNQKKDILRDNLTIVKRNEAFIEDIAPDGAGGYENGHVTRQEFEGHYLQMTPDEAFHDVEEEMPFLPSTLSTLERQVVHFLYLDYDYGEISSMLAVPRKEVAPLVRRIREKLADWKPSGGSEPRPTAEGQSDSDPQDGVRGAGVDQAQTIQAGADHGEDGHDVKNNVNGSLNKAHATPAFSPS